MNGRPANWPCANSGSNSLHASRKQAVPPTVPGKACASACWRHGRSLPRACRIFARRWGVDRHYAEVQATDHLPGFGQYQHLPSTRRLRGEMALVRPGPVAFLATAADIQRNAVDLDTVQSPDATDARLPAARR